MEEIRIFKLHHVHYRGGAWAYPCPRCVYLNECKKAKKTTGIGEFECFNYTNQFQIDYQRK